MGTLPARLHVHLIYIKDGTAISFVPFYFAFDQSRRASRIMGGFVR